MPQLLEVSLHPGQRLGLLLSLAPGRIDGLRASQVSAFCQQHEAPLIAVARGPGCFDAKASLYGKASTRGET